ncbi:MAG: lytic transglycosylase domain-containing protein [Ferruginibacter sp.]
MKKIFFIPLLSLLLLNASAKALGILKTNTLQLNVADTIVEEEIEKEDSLLDEVAKSRVAPTKEKVQYFNQVTKYGFKNLFSNSSYNASLPYNAQINPNAEIFVQDYMKAHGSYLKNMKTWGVPYFNLIENILQQYGLPRELKYIAVIESNLSSGATSNVGAGGPWQFMPYTARDYGLVVNGYQDDRRDYYKSTHAAARYLLYLYRQMHDWLLVMAAYNGGPGRVYAAIKKSGSKNFWSLQQYLPAESRIYVKRFIATHYIMEGTGGVTTNVNSLANMDLAGANFGRTDYPSNNGTANPYKPPASLSADELVDVEVLPVSGKYSSVVIAKTLAMDIALFNHYNPNFDGMMSSDGNFDLRLPPEKMQLFIANKYQILNESVQLLLNGAVAPVNKTVYPPAKEKKKNYR